MNERTDEERWMGRLGGLRVQNYFVLLNCISLLHTQTQVKGLIPPQSHTNLTGHFLIDPVITTRGTGSVYVYFLFRVNMNIANFSSCTFSSLCFFISSNLISKTNRTSVAHNGTVKQRLSVIWLVKTKTNKK